MKAKITKRINYWRYLGYNHDALKNYETQVAEDNLKVLSGGLWVALLVTIIEIGIISVFLMTENGESNSLMNTAKLLVVAGTVPVVELGICIFNKNKLNSVQLSRWLTTLFVAYWCLTSILISTVINTGDYAVVICGTFLAVQVLFDSYPVENLLFISCAYFTFMILSFLRQPFDVFLYNLLDSIPFLLIGNYLSWIKARSKWTALINTDARIQLEKQKIENKLLQARISIMLSQIQPHFLYNALGVIYHLCDKDPKTAKRATADFSKYLRTNLDSLKMDAPVSFETELNHMQIYLSLEKMRFGDELNVVYDIQAKGFLIPVLTIQPLVENAVKYGVGKKPCGGTVTISSRETQDNYQVVVSDDGVGFDPYKTQEDGRSHIGIDNVKKRLWSMSAAELDIKSEKGVGTIATITIPKGGYENENHSGG